MMPHIEVLDQATINQIAAGEVVERPSSVVKELVENAIDAGATAITVEIKEGGTKLIRITDNGCGIEKEQVRTAFLRHSTSKIRKASDLFEIGTLGFRGEALASVAAVAQVEIITKTPSALTGVSYVIHGGVEQSFEEIGAPEGTTFVIQNLFYNTPVRKKFLKSPSTEGSYVADLMERMALSHPELSMRLIVNGQNKLHTTGSGRLRDLIYMIYGREVSSHVLAVEQKGTFLHVSGVLGKPVISRGNRSYETYFVNGRYIKSALLNKAIEDAYKPFLMQHRYPFVVLNIRLEKEFVDVNVHPNKMEIRFQQEQDICDELYRILAAVLANREFIPQAQLDDSEKKKEETMVDFSRAEPFEKQRMQEDWKRLAAQTGTWKQERPLPVTALEEVSKAVCIQEEDLDEPQIGADLLKKAGQATAPMAGRRMSLAGNLYPTSQEERTNHLSKNISEENTYSENESVSGEKAYSEKETAPEENAGSGDESALKENAGQLNEMVSEEKNGTSALPVQEIDREAGQETNLPSGEQLTLFDDKLLSKKARSRHRLIGQLFETYWLIEYEDKLFIIDQHAAHEKVLYERMMKAYEKKQILPQMVEPPWILTLTVRQENTWKKNREAFMQLGFEVEYFGGMDYAVHSIPSNLYGIREKDLFIDLLDDLETEPNKPSSQVIEKLASMSCKAAVKGNHALSTEEANALIDQLLELENPYACPHGRPTIISMSKYELEKKFKRIV